MDGNTMLNSNRNDSDNSIFPNPSQFDDNYCVSSADCSGDFNLDFGNSSYTQYACRRPCEMNERGCSKIPRGSAKIRQGPTPRQKYSLQPVFHERSKHEDDSLLSNNLWKLARKTGTLNLTNKGMARVPERLYDINEADADSKRADLVKLSINEEDAWWNQVPINNLDLSSNALTHISPKIENLLTLTVLQLHDNALVSLPPEIGKLEKLVRLNLSHNKLSELPAEFYSLPELRHLNISHNEFLELNPDISNLHMLEFLDAGNNNINTVPGGIGFLVRLTALLLANNHIKELPTDIVNMRSLQKLDLMKNDLIALPEDMGLMRKLECLYVQHNDIKELPTFEGNEMLSELHASNNFIESVPQDLCANLPHLKIFDLRDNKITQLPDEICLMRNLNRLDLTNNSISVLPVTLSSLAHLISLQVDGNPIKTIRRDILQCGTARILKTLHDRAQAKIREEGGADEEAPCSSRSSTGSQGAMNNLPNNMTDRYKLRHTRTLAVNLENLTNVPEHVFQLASSENVHVVDFARNQLGSLPQGLQLMSNLVTELVLAHNVIASVPTFITQFTRITFLNLSNNQIRDLPNEFGVLNTLRELNIANNRFEFLPKGLYELQGLEILIASENHIKALNVDGLKGMPRLSTLDLRNNDIEFIPPILGNLTNITHLELVGNPFRQPRHQILMKGTDAIMSYLRDRIPI
ncbi:leucine-rich repeat-containing protein 40 isoform X3 [Drosophila grimshawi]|uniref:leucine-rich repeat-containing protein 40 isoform X3 n=1 Tax=Drosophila grimshawi TaxID=7222 RepID=UPI000C87010A|nr:leucine-rich repeat-containing protein 40 isoform X3 [Drosophila grimshawi]